MPFFNTNLLLDVERKPGINSALYAVIGVVLCIVVGAVLIGLVLAKIRAARKPANWLEVNKDKPTKKANIDNVALQANLSAEEKRVLEATCKNFNPRNLEYLIRDKSSILDLFRRQYGTLRSSGADDDKMQTFFEMVRKIDRLNDSLSMISNPKAIPEGQKLTYLDADRSPWTLTLDRIDSQGIVIAIPQQLYASEKKPAPLAKFVMTFKTDTGSSYALLSRVVRYEEEKSGKFILIASSNSTLTAAQRRGSKRRSLTVPCKFSSVKPTKQGKTVDDEIAEKRYDGKMHDVSTGGCRFDCQIPIKQGQYLNVEFAVGDGNPFQVIGYIVMTTKGTEADGAAYILHIKFVDIDIAVKNKIAAFVYDYN
ncbi:MAG: PilZ domain-containing protein [Treponema sp.]|nr:PilZ domain-containing protein [Treponema sp.]